MSNSKLSREDRLRARQFSGKGQGKVKVLQLPDDVQPMMLEAETTTTLDFVLFPVSNSHPQYLEIKKDAEEYGEERLVDWKFEYAVHKRIHGMPEVICHQYTYGRPCPICEAKKTRMEEENLEWDDKKLDEYAYSRRVAYLVAEVDGGEYKVLDYPSGWLQKVLEEKGKKENILFLDESEDGHSVKLTPIEHEFDGNTMAGKCMVKFQPRKVGFTKGDLDAAFNIVDFFNIQTYDEIYEIFHGMDIAEPTGTVSRGRGRTVSTEEVADDEDFEETPVKTEEKPSGRRGRGATSTDVKEAPTGSRRRRAAVQEDIAEEDIPF